MEDQLSYFLLTVLTLLFFVFTACKTWALSPKDKDSPPILPPGPRKLPLIGHLHLLVGTLPHRALTDMSKKYGPVMHLKLGEVSTVIISSPEVAKEVMKDKDANFTERPYLYAAESITYNFKDMVFSRGEYRIRMRKICVLELFNSKRVQSFRGTREEHVSKLVRTILENQGTTINLRNLLYSLSLAIVSQAAFGGKSKHQEGFMSLCPELAARFGGFSIVDVFPSIKFLRLINKLRPTYKQFHEKVDEILESIIDEHKADKSTEADDFVQVLLNIQERGDPLISLSTSSIKAIILVRSFLCKTKLFI